MYQCHNLGDASAHENYREKHDGGCLLTRGSARLELLDLRAALYE